MTHSVWLFIKKMCKEINDNKSNNFENGANGKRKKNLIVSGVRMGTNDECEFKEDIENFIKGEFGVEPKMRNVRKIGVKTCLMELENMTGKIKVRNRKRKQKINKDFKQEKDIYKILFER